eukprot:2480249-Pyramimonas_sp.AAC.1
MAAGSTFKWKPLKEQAATLFPLPLAPRNKYQGGRKWRPQPNSVNMTNNDAQYDEVWHDDEQWHEDDDHPEPEYHYRTAGWWRRGDERRLLVRAAPRGLGTRDPRGFRGVQVGSRPPEPGESGPRILQHEGFEQGLQQRQGEVRQGLHVPSLRQGQGQGQGPRRR